MEIMESGRLFGTPVGKTEPRQGQGQGQGQDHEKMWRRRAALQLQMVLALTLPQHAALPVGHCPSISSSHN